MQFNFVVATNERAVRLWERLGFAVVGRLPGAFRHQRLGYVDALVMFKTLVAGGRRLSSAAMSTKKPVMGRGLEALLGQMSQAGRSPRPARRRQHRAAPAREQAAGRRTRQPAARPAAAGQVPAARGHAPGIARGAGRLHQGAGHGAAHRRAAGGWRRAGRSQRYEIIAGERRWRAAQIAGLPPCPPSSAACRTKPRSPWRSSRTSSAKTSIRSKKRARSIA